MVVFMGIASALLASFLGACSTGDKAAEGAAEATSKVAAPGEVNSGQPNNGSETVASQRLSLVVKGILERIEPMLMYPDQGTILARWLDEELEEPFDSPLPVVSPNICVSSDIVDSCQGIFSKRLTRIYLSTIKPTPSDPDVPDDRLDIGGINLFIKSLRPDGSEAAAEHPYEINIVFNLNDSLISADISNGTAKYGDIYKGLLDEKSASLSTVSVWKPGSESTMLTVQQDGSVMSTRVRDGSATESTDDRTVGEDIGQLEKEFDAAFRILVDGRPDIPEGIEWIEKNFPDRES